MNWKMKETYKKLLKFKISDEEYAEAYEAAINSEKEKFQKLDKKISSEDSI